jgi:hypothetical protein
MTKKRALKARARRVRKPAWVDDVSDQNQWIAEFTKKLREISRTDRTITAILANERVLHQCGIQLRLYSDLDVTAYFYQDRRRRGKRQVARLKAAIKGMTEAIEFYKEFRNEAATSQLEYHKGDLSAILQRSKVAYSSKRHGRDRDHTILVRLREFLQKETAPVTNATLATLVSKAMEVDGQPDSSRISEETVRRALRSFQGRNQVMMTLVGRESPDAFRNKLTKNG